MSFRSIALALAAILAIPLAACSAESPGAKEARAREATASALGALADEIVISELEPGAAKWSWRAATGGKTYECDADELLRLPDCRPVG